MFVLQAKVGWFISVSAEFRSSISPIVRKQGVIWEGEKYRTVKKTKKKRDTIHGHHARYVVEGGFGRLTNEETHARVHQTDRQPFAQEGC